VRLFVAIDIPKEIREVLADFVSQLRAIAPQVKWVRTDNLHVTVKFLGHTDPAKLQAIENALSAIHSHAPITLEFRGLGFFPSEKPPRVLWAGMEASTNLKSIAADVDHATHKLGFPFEERPFAPHLTLARFDPPAIAPKLGAAIVERASQTFGIMTTRELQLIESKLKPTGAEYTTLHSFPFAAET
jgi:RNA 2',3'-cyclic 3'-phosphodiesterase